MAVPTPFVIPGANPFIISGTAPAIPGLSAQQQAAAFLMQRAPGQVLLSRTPSISALTPAQVAAARVTAANPAVQANSQSIASHIAGWRPASQAAARAAQAAPAAASGAAPAAASAGAGGLGPLPGLGAVNANLAGTGATMPLSGAAGRVAAFAGNPTWLTARMAGGSTAGLGLRSLAAGSLGRAGLYGAAGQLAGMGIEGALGARDGTGDDVLRNMATMAGAGAGIGSMFGPWGTAIGGIGGGIVGGVHGLLTGRDSKETEASRALMDETDKFNETFEQYGVSQPLRDQFLMQFALTTDGMGRKDVRTAATELRQMLPQLIIEDAAEQEEERGRTAMFAAAQSWMQPMMQQVNDRANQYATALGDTMYSNAEGISDPNQRALALEEARRIPLDTATQQAYAMQQMMSLPGLYGYQTSMGNNGVPQMDLQSILGATPIGNAQSMQRTAPVADTSWVNQFK